MMQVVLQLKSFFLNAVAQNGGKDKKTMEVQNFIQHPHCVLQRVPR